VRNSHMLPLSRLDTNISQVKVLAIAKPIVVLLLHVKSTINQQKIVASKPIGQVVGENLEYCVHIQGKTDDVANQTPFS
jgi:hypothetical protein